MKYALPFLLILAGCSAPKPKPPLTAKLETFQHRLARKIMIAEEYAFDLPDSPEGKKVKSAVADLGRDAEELDFLIQTLKSEQKED